MSRPSSRGSVTPGAESVNKWKIPHYYRRSSGASSHQSSGSEAGTPTTPGTNSMSSPKKVLVEDLKKGKKRPAFRSRKNSKKKAGEMVFVNYTVQDTASEENVVDSAPILPPTPAISHKKKSSRSRMLKIFGSSKEPSETDDGAHLAACPENDGLYELESAQLSSKRSCSSFLRYGRFHHGHSKRPESTAHEEVVPKSSQSPNLMKPASNGIFFGNSSRKVKYLGGMVKNETSPEDSINGKPSDENDASIAFSKMFTRNGANTSGSTSSLISLNQNPHDQQSQSHATMGVPALKKNMSASSISSLSYRCSPIRNASPARPRSGTRGSYTASLHSVIDTEDAHNAIFTGNDTYLDSRVGNRNTSVLRHKKKQDSISDTHRLYSTSASASTFLNNNSNAVTPSSSSLVTPPPFTPGCSLPSNTSASSTPSVMEYAHVSQPPTFNGSINSSNSLSHHSAFNINRPLLERDSSSDILFGDSDMPTPVDNQPALRGVSKATVEEEEEEQDRMVQEGIPKNTSKNRNLSVRQKIDNLEILLPHGSSTGSSQGGSILTNSTSSIPESSIMGHWQDSNCYSLFDSESGIKGEDSEKVSSGRTLKVASSSNLKNGENEDIVDTGAMGKDFYAQFDFDNAAAFFHEQSILLAPEFGHVVEQPARNVSTPIDEQASAVTSIANYSPGAAATISIEDTAHRDDRSHHANAMMHSSSNASQGTVSHSTGQWKSINNDLDALTNSLGISDEINDLSFT